MTWGKAIFYGNQEPFVTPLLTVNTLFLKRSDNPLHQDPLSFAVHEGESLCILGKNGTGKTTLLRTLAGLHPAPETAVIWNASFSFVGHHDLQSMTLTVKETLNFWGSYFGHRGQEAVETFDLAPLLQKKIYELSEGQRQRLALARLLCGKFQTWIIDEPFAHLDQAFSTVLEDLFATHLKAKGALLFSDHRQKSRSFPYRSIELLQEAAPA
jgi:heme exporter protein A